MITQFHGFSLPELLVTTAIITILAGIAIPGYVNYSKSSEKTAMKTELAELSKSLSYAHSVDGGYHQKIYTMGYKPSHSAVKDTGFGYTRTDTLSCSSFSSLTSTSPASAFSPFLTLTKNIFDSSKPDSATRASHITGKSHPVLSQQNFTSGHAGCKTAFSKAIECGCDTFIIYSSSDTGNMFSNQDGIFAYSDKANHIDLLE